MIPQVGVGLSSDGYPAFNNLPNGQTRRLHTIAAERALGRKLPIGAAVHHVDLNKMNYSNTNLVICPDNAYHKLLHVRTAALDACGDANYRKCVYCGHYDAPGNLGGAAGIRVRHWHTKCHNQYQKAWRQMRCAR